MALVLTTLLAACSSTPPDDPPPLTYTPPAPEAPDCTGATPEPGPEIARRLTAREYTNTVRDVLGVDVEARAASLPLESYVEGFRNTAWALNVSPRHIEQYAQLARFVADALEPGFVARFVAATDDCTADACERAFVEALGLRLFRRPLEADEVARFATLFDVAAREGEDFERGARLVVEAMVQAPQFLYRIESRRTDTTLAASTLLEAGAGLEVAAYAPLEFDVDLAAGDYRLRVRAASLQDVPAPLRVQRDGQDVATVEVMPGPATEYVATMRVRAADAGRALLGLDMAPGVEGATLIDGFTLVGPLPLAVEIDADGTGEGVSEADVRPLTGYELATRLSYFVWHSAPDAALLDAAARGALDGPEGIVAEVERMLDDARARRAFRDYVAEWLYFDELDTVERSASMYPEFGPELVEDMKEETWRFVEDVAWEAHRDLLELFTARYTFVTPALARLYDLEPARQAASEGGWQRVAFDEESPRAGLLSQASFLTMSSDNDVPSPVRRGKLVRNRFMCQTIPPPPSNSVMQAAPDTQGLPTRERLSAHSEDRGCAFCHKQMDPIGFGFEHFDTIGAWRTHDELGHPVDASGTLHDGPRAVDFYGARGLGELLADSAIVEQCMVEQVFQYAMGRPPLEADVCQIHALVERFRDGGRGYRDLVVAIATSDAFRHVRAP